MKYKLNKSLHKLSYKLYKQLLDQRSCKLYKQLYIHIGDHSFYQFRNQLSRQLALQFSRQLSLLIYFISKETSTET